MTYNLEKFLKGLEELQIELSDNQIQQFIRYYEMLVEKNKVMNLTGITDFEEVVRLDNEYIMNFSISLDIKILIKTVFTVLKRKGSV